MKNIFLLFISLSFQPNFSLLLSGEVSLVGKVKLEESDAKNLSPYLEVSQISKTGKFAIANFVTGSSDSIVMDSNGRYLRFKKESSSSTSSTNILGTIVENGVLKVIQSEKQEINSIKNSLYEDNLNFLNDKLFKKLDYMTSNDLLM